MRLYRFVIENNLYEVERDKDITHWSDGTKFTYMIDYKSVKPVVSTISDNAPAAYYLGYASSDYAGERWVYVDPGHREGRDLEVSRFERDLWMTRSWRQVGSDLGWEIYQKPSRKQWVLMAMPTSRSVRELMVVPVECNIWRVYTRDAMLRQETVGDEVIYFTIRHGGTERPVILPDDAPFNPDDYTSYGTDNGWPLYTVNGKQWKVTYRLDSKVAVFKEVLAVDPVISSPVIDINIVDMPLRFTNIVANGQIDRVVLRDGSPFDPNNYQIYDIDAEGWPIYLVDRVEWVVKKGYDDTSSLPFAKFERRIIEQSVNVPVDTIYRQGVPMVVELPFDAPFIPSEQTVHGRTHDGWNEYDIGGRLWKVSAVDGVAVFTEMTWPVIEVITEVEKEKEKEEVKEEGVVPIVVVKDDEKKEDPVIIELGGGSESEDDMTDPKLEVSYVPFVALVGLLGLFSIMAQRK